MRNYLEKGDQREWNKKNLQITVEHVLGGKQLKKTENERWTQALGFSANINKTTALLMNAIR